MLAGDGVEASREADEERVAGGVAVHVVVALEAVEVEHHHDVRLERLLLAELRERRLEAPPVPEPGERVGDRVVPARAQHRAVLDQAQAHARDDHEQAAGRKRERKRADAVEVVVDDQAEADEREGRRHERQRAHVAGRSRARRRHRAREREEDHRGRPAEIDVRAVLVGPARDLEEVDRVGDREQAERERDQEPRRRHASRTERQEADDQREQDQVPERVGEVHGDRGGVAPGRREHAVEDDRSGDRGDRQPGEQAVDPERPREADELCAGEQARPTKTGG